MNRRVGEVVLVALAIVLCLMGVLSDDWYARESVEEEARIHVGPREVQVCDHGHCESVSLRTIESSKAVTMGGNVAFFAALIASVLGALAAALHLAGRPVAGPISPARLAAAFFAAAALGALTYLIVRPGRDTIDLAMGAAGPMTVAGGLLGTVGAVMIALYRPRPDPAAHFLEVAAAPAPIAAAPAPAASRSMAPACPQCAAPTAFVDRHQRWFCAGCRAYV